MAVNITIRRVIEARRVDIMELRERLICRYCYLFAVRAKAMCDYRKGARIEGECRHPGHVHTITTTLLMYSVMLWLECHMSVPWWCCLWIRLLTWFSTSLIRPQLPVFLCPRPHCCSRVHMATHLLHSSGCSQMTTHFQLGAKANTANISTHIFSHQLISLSLLSS